MRRRAAYEAERRRLLGDLRAAFAPEVFGAAYPGCTAPLSVSIGGDSEKLAFEVFIDPIPTGIENEHRTTTCPAIATGFDLVVDITTSGATEAAATGALLDYLDCIYQVCMADPSLGGLVDHLHPTPEMSGSGADANFGYVAEMRVRLSCRTDVKPNKQIQRAVREASRPTSDGH